MVLVDWRASLFLAPTNSELAAQKHLVHVMLIPSVALGILVGTMAGRGVRIARQKRNFFLSILSRMFRPEPDYAGAKLMVSLPNTTSRPTS